MVAKSRGVEIGGIWPGIEIISEIRAEQHDRPGSGRPTASIKNRHVAQLSKLRVNPFPTFTALRTVFDRPEKGVSFFTEKTSINNEAEGILIPPFGGSNPPAPANLIDSGKS